MTAPAAWTAIEQVREAMSTHHTFPTGVHSRTLDMCATPYCREALASLGLLQDLADAAEKVSAVEVAWVSGSDHDLLRAALARVRGTQEQQTEP